MVKLLFRILILWIVGFGSCTPAFSQAPETGAKAIETIPSYRGGNDAMLKFIQENLKLPQGYKSKAGSGQVVVKFRVDKSGKVGDVTVAQSMEPALDSAAVNVVRAMPSWNPGTKEGNPVDAYMTLPVNFTFK